MKLKLIEEETCPRCGNKFDCGKSGKCWCYQVTVEPSILEKLLQTYDCCLCPACLNEVSNADKKA